MGKETSNRNETWSQKVYGFDISKADLIFDVLVKDKQLLLSDDHKLLTPDQLKGRKYCKYHNKIGHATNGCIRFRDLIQKAIKDGRLKFETTKPTMKVDSDPLPAEANLAEPVEFEINMVEISDKRLISDSRYLREQYEKHQKKIYPSKDESLVDYLCKKKDEGKNIALCSRCSALFDMDAAREYEAFDVKRYYNWLASKRQTNFNGRYNHWGKMKQLVPSVYLSEKDVPEWYLSEREIWTEWQSRSLIPKIYSLENLVQTTNSMPLAPNRNLIIRIGINGRGSRTRSLNSKQSQKLKLILCSPSL